MRSELDFSKQTGATVLSSALEIKGRHVSPEAARFILDLGIRGTAKRRMCALLAKQQKGRITVAEKDELESYVQADNVLSILKARAILALKTAGQEL